MTAVKTHLYICVRVMKRCSMHTPQKTQICIFSTSLRLYLLLAGLLEGTTMKFWFKKQVGVIHFWVTEKSYLHKL